MFAYTKIMQALVAAGVTPASTDPYFNLVTLLLNTTTTNGAQNNTFLDSSSNGLSITRNGNTTQGTFTPFSQTGWSNYFDGSSYLNVGTSGQSDFNFPAPSGSTNDFCIELWFYATGTLSATTYTALVGCHDGVDSSSWSTFVRSNGVFIYGSTNTFTGGGTVNSNAWNHAVFVRSVDNVSVYLNGSRVDTQIRSGAYNNTSDLLHIGDDNSSTNPPFTGYISNVRILKGSSAAIYSGTTITVPTAPLTAVTGTVLLSSQSNRFVDNSSVASSITVGAGTPRVQAFSPFAPTAAYSTTTVGGSGYFDGATDTLNTDATTKFDFGTGNFTIAVWVYTTSFATEQGIVSSQDNGSSSTLKGWVLNIGTNGSVAFVDYNNASFVTQIASSASVIKLNQWQFIVVERRGTSTNQFQIFVDGVAVATGTSAASIPSTTSNNPLLVGNWRYSTDTNREFTGYMAGLKIDNAAVYNGTVSVPTVPSTAGANTQFLLNFTNAGIYDAAAKNDLETVANAQVSTTQAKFGTTSMYFDGTGDYLLIPDSQNFNFGGDFTIEFWMYANSVTGSIGILGKRASEANYTPFLFEFSGSSTLKLFLSTSGSAWAVNGLSTSALSTATWYHIAATRSGSTVYLFVNGTSVGSTGTASGALMTNTSVVTLGRGSLSSTISDFNGYIDDLRITKGYARYTANFSVPTAAFPVQ